MIQYVYQLREKGKQMNTYGIEVYKRTDEPPFEWECIDKATFDDKVKAIQWVRLNGYDQRGYSLDCWREMSWLDLIEEA
jgi:hypothetical protein